MKKVSAFFLIPTDKPLELPQSIINEIIPMIGSMNCTQPSNDCVLFIEYQISEEQRDEILKICNNAGFSGLFIIAPLECDNIHEHYVEL